jgi:glycosyltransferase involved in cell wall biosynthesis
MKSNGILVVIPIFNIIKSVESILLQIKSISYPDLDILIVDNSSQDGSYEILLEKLKIENRGDIFIKQNSQNLGLGGTLKSTFSNYRYKYNWFLIVHGDGQGKIDLIVDNFINEISIGKHFYIMASRFLIQSDISNYNATRTKINKFLNLISNFILNSALSDFGCGIVAIHSKILDGVKYQSFRSDFLFNPQFNFLVCQKYPDLIKEIPIQWRDSPNKSNLEPFKYTSRYILLLLESRLNFIKGAI